jgi:hypothetical protein
MIRGYWNLGNASYALLDIFFQSIKGQMTYNPPLKKIEKKAQAPGSFSEDLRTLGLFIPRD